MKNLYLLLLVLPLIGFSQGKNQPYSARANPRLAKVIIYRENSSVMKNKGIGVELNGDDVTSMWNNSVYVYELWPQVCKFRLNSEPPVEVSATLDAGVVYYLRIVITEDNGKINPVMDFTTPDNGQRYLSQNRLRQLGSYNPVQDSLKTMKTQVNWAGSDVFSLGACLGSGVGFDPVEMVTLVGGGTSKISAGGGTLFGINAAYRFTSEIDAIMNIQIQSSTLIPIVSNVVVTFDKVELGLALRYTHPFGKHLRFNLGPGLASYPVVMMNADLTKIPGGFKGVYKYGESTGYFVTADMEYYFRSCSLGMGLKYNNCTYTLKSVTANGFSYPINDPSLNTIRTMNGSGISYFWVFRYHL